MEVVHPDLEEIVRVDRAQESQVRLDPIAAEEVPSPVDEMSPSKSVGEIDASLKARYRRGGERKEVQEDPSNSRGAADRVMMNGSDF